MHRGFTLLELTVTLIVVGILAAYVAPRFFDTQAFQERGYVDEVAATLRYAQKIAVASGCEVSVALGVASYSARQRNSLGSCNDAAAPWTTPVRLPDGTTASGTAPGGVQFDAAASIVFGPTGAATSGAPVALAAGPFTLSVVPSGAVTVQP